jgi:hypothetical protein
MWNLLFLKGNTTRDSGFMHSFLSILGCLLHSPPFHVFLGKCCSAQVNGNIQPLLQSPCYVCQVLSHMVDSQMACTVFIVCV